MKQKHTIHRKIYLQKKGSIEKRLNQSGANFNSEFNGGGGSSSTPIATIIKEQLEKT